MDNPKNDKYYADKILSDLLFVASHTGEITLDAFEKNEVLVDSVMFRMIQISENSAKLTDEFKSMYANIPWRAIKGLRNRIVHEYGNVDLSVVYDTVKKDIPVLADILSAVEF